jgi:hypothetical protein
MKWSGIFPGLFIISGIIWIGMILDGSGILLFWPALTGLVSGILLIYTPSGRITSATIVASSLFGLVISIYQLYFATALIFTKFGSLATYSVGVFSAFTLLYLFLLFSSLKRIGSTQE